MSYRLFHVLENGKFIPSELAMGMNSLKNVLDEFGNSSGKVLAYLQYMNDMNPDENPFAKLDENEKQEIILRQTCPELDIIDNEIVEDANELVAKLFETDGSKMYKAFKVVWEQVANSLSEGQVNMEAEGNWKNVLSAVKSYKELRESLKMALEDYQAELGTEVVAKGGRQRNKFSGQSKELN